MFKAFAIPSATSTCNPRRRILSGLSPGLAPGLASVLGALLLLSACGPRAVRGGPGTDNPNLDRGAMSTGLDRVDVQYLVDENLAKLYQSPFWTKEVQGYPGGAPLVAIWPIENNTAQHLDSQMQQLLSSIETQLLNTGAVSVVSRERQSQMAAEVGVQQGAAFNPSTAAQVGRQLGARYYITGKVTATEERMPRARRVQYTLFLQVIEVETSLLKFQYESLRSKALKN